MLNHLGMTQECDRQMDQQIDGRTDTSIANAMLNYVAPSKRKDGRTKVFILNETS